MKHSRVRFLKQVKNFAAINARMTSGNITLAVTQTVSMIRVLSKSRNQIFTSNKPGAPNVDCLKISVRKTI